MMRGALIVLTIILFALWLNFQTPPEIPVLDVPVERIVIDKSDREMRIYSEGALVVTYPVALGFAPDGHKQQQGDGRTPEGIYSVDRRNPGSRYHLSLGLDYPRAEDRARAAAAGVSPGGDIFIHGQPNAVPDTMMIPGDWTAGCIALTNPQMDALYAHTAIGTPVEIRP